MNQRIAFIFLALLAVGSIATTTSIVSVYAGEVNPAHDADNGNGNEQSHGQCKQEANNDQACDAKK